MMHPMRSMVLARVDAQGSLVGVEGLFYRRVTNCVHGDLEAGPLKSVADKLVVVGGYFASPSIIFGSATLTNANSKDGFVAAIDMTMPSVTWAQPVKSGIAEADWVAGVTVDDGSRVGITGVCGESCTFGDGGITKQAAMGSTQNVFACVLDASDGMPADLGGSKAGLFAQNVVA